MLFSILLLFSTSFKCKINYGILPTWCWKYSDTPYIPIWMRWEIESLISVFKSYISLWKIVYKSSRWYLLSSNKTFFGWKGIFYGKVTVLNRITAVYFIWLNNWNDIKTHFECKSNFCHFFFLNSKFHIAMEYYGWLERISYRHKNEKMSMGLVLNYYNLINSERRFAFILEIIYYEAEIQIIFMFDRIYAWKYAVGTGSSF